MWSQTYSLPPNDARLLRLSEREALEQIFLRRALVKLQTRTKSEAKPGTRLSGPNFESLGRGAEVSVADDDEARALADTPVLTGDPEWDAWELDNT